MFCYSFFHLNLLYSSIEENERKKVIETCYRPLLELAESGIPLGIEATGITLELISKLDPAWIEKFKFLLQEDKLELIGSGYSQIIGPLVPAKVNMWNQKLGIEVYKELLNVTPKTALINEMAYSAGVVEHYIKCGYEAVIMEWNNPRKYHPEWEYEWQYYPQYAVGSKNSKIKLIWANSIAFQKFQRYVHGEYDIEEYMEYLHEHAQTSFEEIYFPIYGNDTEIFNFRPGRYATETSIDNKTDEWQRINELFQILKENENYSLVLPSNILKHAKTNQSYNDLQLESPGQPIPVKKQDKYNLTRWAVTGRNDAGINSVCWNIFKILESNDNINFEDWKELCYLWSSDFRTHITAKRWKKYEKRLKGFQEKICSNEKKIKTVLSISLDEKDKISAEVNIIKEKRFITIETPELSIKLNQHKGLAIDYLKFVKIAKLPIIGTIPHGYYTDISMSADFFSGHLVADLPGKAKVSDLAKVDSIISWESEYCIVKALIKTALGDIEKRIRIAKNKPEIEIEYLVKFAWNILGAFRLGHLTFFPENIDANSFYWETHNGGERLEKFYPKGNEVFHGNPVSFLVSANQGLGMTEGVIWIGDKDTCLKVEIEKELIALIPFITIKKVKNKYFYRLAFTARELDETSKHFPSKRRKNSQLFRFKISSDS